MTSPSDESSGYEEQPLWEEPAPPYGDPFAAPPPPGDGGRRRKWIPAVALLAAGALVGAGVGHAAWGHSANAARQASGNGSSAGTGPGGLPGLLPGGGAFGEGPFGGSGNGKRSSSGTTTSDGPTNAASIARKVDPAVVDIDIATAEGRAAGTGMVLTSDGEVLTNNHVIDGAVSITARDVGNGRTYHATVVGYDRSADIALLRLSGASGLATVTTASNPPSTGTPVVGVGNAGGTGGTPTYAGGSITATGQSITASDDADGTSERLAGLLQTDADIRPGDSGGALTNIDGQVLGMVTAASSRFNFNGSSASQGFAIPIATAVAIAHQIASGASSATVHVGPTAELGVYVVGGAGVSSTHGAPIEQVKPGSAAAEAGLAGGDVITSIGGTTVSSADDLTSAMTRLRPGQTVTIIYLGASGQRHTTSATLGSGAPQ